MVNDRFILFFFFFFFIFILFFFLDVFFFRLPPENKQRDDIMERKIIFGAGAVKLAYDSKLSGASGNAVSYMGYNIWG